jgi:replicative DNA helicase
MAVAQLATVLDRPLPQSHDAERAVLGSILLNNHAFYRVVGIIDTEDFFRDAHRLIFTAMRLLADGSRSIDLLTVKEELAKHAQLERAGGYAYVSSLVDGIPDIANVERYARIVKEKSQLRRLVAMGSSVIRAASEAPSEPGDVLSLAEEAIHGIAERTTEKGFVGLDRIVKTNLSAIEQMERSGSLMTGIPTGYDRLNEMTSGFQLQDLVIIAARPAMGKTSLLMNIAAAIAVPNRFGSPVPPSQRLHSVGFFSLEMSKEQIGLRILSSESGVSGWLIRGGHLSERNWSDLAEASARLAKATLFVDDSPGMDILGLRAKARRLKMEAGLDVVMVDYLQLMTVRGRTESRNQEISQVSRGLKAVAKELNVPVVALSQLSRRPEQRSADHRPQLADLRESGAIEQDADLVAFIYRDEVYNKESLDKGLAEIIIAKQRNGPIGDFKLVFRNDITKFFNYTPLS